MKKMRPNEIFAEIKKSCAEAVEEAASGAVIIPRDELLKVAQYLKNGGLGFDNLHCVTAVDRKDRFEAVYILYSTTMGHSLTLKVFLAPTDLKIASLAGMWKSADWLERETYDMFGVTFEGHPDPRRILNPDDWRGYPLRKDFAHPDFIKKPRL